MLRKHGKKAKDSRTRLMTLCSTPARRTDLATSTFTRFELLIVVAILVVIIAIAMPVYKAMRQRAHKAVALDKMRTLGGALANYAAQNAGALPAEDADGKDDWYGIAKPEAKDAWYNALPRLIGRKGAADFASSAADFYKDENLLFLPGANYPEKKKFIEPMFAIAFNSKLQRTDASGEKQKARLDEITNQPRTVLLLEQGLLNEKRTLEIQSKKDYDGRPKGSAKSFVGRYDGGKGVLYFADWHAELAPVKETLTETGRFPMPQTEYVWTRTPEEDPNKSGEAGQAKKKEKDKGAK
jgi:Tfp pilus assembly protein PilE